MGLLQPGVRWLLGCSRLYTREHIPKYENNIARRTKTYRDASKYLAKSQHLRQLGRLGCMRHAEILSLALQLDLIGLGLHPLSSLPY